MAQRGGARPNAGNKKGVVFQKTIDKKKAESAFHQLILQRLSRLVNSQFQLAQGLSFVYKIVEETSADGKKTFRKTVLVEDPEEIRQFLEENEGSDGTVDDTYYFITTKPPDGRALDSLIDRVFGKAKQSMEIDNPNETAALKEFNEKMNEMIENAKLRTKQVKKQDNG